jgi:eukaryotic-like serine/threonine-protein kinase
MIYRDAQIFIMLNKETTLKEGVVLNGRYVVKEKIGQGGCGITYLAYDNIQNFTVVVKQFDPNSSNHQKQKSPEVVAALKIAFVNEAKLLKKLGNSSRLIPRRYDFFEDGNNFYIIQEFIEGVDLSSELKEGNIFSEAETIEMIGGILIPLQDIHTRNIIHRDLKPSNIRIRTINENEDELVLIDFGIAKEILEDNEIGLVTEMGVGTEGYRPKEQKEGKPVPASDIYPIGIMGLQAITGLGVSALIGLKERELQVIKGGRILSGANIKASSNLIEFLKYTLTEDLNLRYPNAAEALKALNNLDRIVPFDVAAQARENTVTEGNIPPRPTSKRSKSSLLKVIGVIGLLIGVYSSSLITIFGAAPKVVEMLSGAGKQWQTYNRPEYGVHLSRPSDWEVVDHNPESDLGVLATIHPPDQIENCQDKIFVKTTKPEKLPLNLPQYREDTIDRIKKINQKVSEIKNETTDGTKLSRLPAFRLNYQREDSKCATRKLIEINTININNGRTYSVLYNASPQTFEQGKSTFEKIIASFIID